MGSVLEALWSRRAGLLPAWDGRAWQRTRRLLESVWKPRPRTEVVLPNWVHVLVGLSDDGLRIPGTKVRLGLDALLGTLLPGAGDVLGGVTAAMVMFVAWRHGASRDILLKMLGNATVDIAFGSIPVVGDIFDLGFHANRRNLSLLEGFLQQRSNAKRASRLSAVLCFGFLIGVMLLVLAGLVGLAVVAWREMQH